MHSLESQQTFHRQISLLQLDPQLLSTFFIQIMATNGDLALDEPHKSFDTILTLDFGSVTPTRFLDAKSRVISNKSTDLSIPT
jgi:hypothetical protein